MNKSRRILIENSHKTRHFYKKFLIILYIKILKYNVTFKSNLKLTMYETIKKNWDKTKYLLISGLIVTFLFLVTVVYKSDEKITKKSESILSSQESPDLKTFKKFILNQIRSPFINLNYEIKRGDTIQKILKRYKVKNNEIQIVINQYK